MPKTKVLITVKTYPSISSKYDELVCTAGFLEDGSWIRIFPIQFRKKAYNEQYSKYEWVELDLVKNKSDFRPESFRPISHDTPIKILNKIETNKDWRERKKIVLKNVHYNLKNLIAEAHDKKKITSLAVFKPSKVLNFVVKPVSRDWDKDKIAKLEAERMQFNLFEQPEKPFEVVRKLPYKFCYEFEDNEGTISTLMIEDWEIGQLFWRCLEKHEGDENKAVADVKKKYFDDFALTKDLYLFLGTSQLHHYVSNNPFMIIGTFHPPFINQLDLFD